MFDSVHALMFPTVYTFLLFRHAFCFPLFTKAERRTCTFSLPFLYKFDFFTRVRLLIFLKRT